MGSSDSDVVVVKTSRASTIPNMKAVAVFVVAALLVAVAAARPQQQEQLALRFLAEDLAEDASEDVNADNDVAATDRRFDYAGLCKWCIKMGIQIGHPDARELLAPASKRLHQ